MIWEKAQQSKASTYLGMVDTYQPTAKTRYVASQLNHYIYVLTGLFHKVAALHADAEKVRDKGSNLRMYHKHNMTGYTGYAPRDAKNDIGEMKCGANPATTSGASALNLML